MALQSATLVKQKMFPIKTSKEENKPIVAEKMKSMLRLTNHLHQGFPGIFELSTF